MEIISTGGLPANLSKEDFYKGVSKPVNEELARIFIRLDLMEQTGHGVPLVVSRYGKEVFDFMDFFIKVTIPFAFKLKENGTHDGDAQTFPKLFPKLFPKMSSKDIQTMELIVRVLQQEKTAKELAVVTKMSTRTLKDKFLSKLLDEEIVALTIPDKPTSRNQKYILSEKWQASLLSKK